MSKQQGIIKARKNILIAQILDATGIFTERIYVEFVPDIVNVKYTQYDGETAETFISVLYTDLVNNDICSIIFGTTLTPDTTFKINGPVNGDYLFQVKTLEGSVDTTRLGDLVLHLEFIQFE